jgi:hypothetical protein
VDGDRGKVLLDEQLRQSDAALHAANEDDHLREGNSDGYNKLQPRKR